MTTVSAGIDGGQPWHRSSGDHVTCTDWRRRICFRALQELLGGALRVGIGFDHIHLDDKHDLEAALPGVTFVDAGQPSMWKRTIKSDGEIALIMEGARTGDTGGWAYAGAIEPGRAEHEVAIATTSVMLHEIASNHPYVELLDIESGVGQNKPLR